MQEFAIFRRIPQNFVEAWEILPRFAETQPIFLVFLYLDFRALPTLAESACGRAAAVQSGWVDRCVKQLGSEPLRSEQFRCLVLPAQFRRLQTSSFQFSSDRAKPGAVAQGW